MTFTVVNLYYLISTPHILFHVENIFCIEEAEIATNGSGFENLA